MSRKEYPEKQQTAVGLVLGLHGSMPDQCHIRQMLSCMCALDIIADVQLHVCFRYYSRCSEPGCQKRSWQSLMMQDQRRSAHRVDELSFRTQLHWLGSGWTWYPVCSDWRNSYDNSPKTITIDQLYQSNQFQSALSLCDSDGKTIASNSTTTISMASQISDEFHKFNLANKLKVTCLPGQAFFSVCPCEVCISLSMICPTKSN